MIQEKGTGIFIWDQQGYSPLVFSDGWQVAILNWEPTFDLQKFEIVEQHVFTDEVFVLIQGKAVLFTLDAEGDLCVNEMQPGVVYNVGKAVWHNLVSSKDAKWIIVENRDTHLHDTTIRSLTPAEKDNIQAQFPAWVAG